MAVMRPHLALNVTDVERSIPFYRALFGAEPAKVRPGYAKFEIAEPALNLTLNEGDRDENLGAFNHAGIQVESTDDVLLARAAARRGRVGHLRRDGHDLLLREAGQDLGPRP